MIPSRPNLSDFYTPFQKTKWLENHTIHSSKYPYNLYMRICCPLRVGGRNASKSKFKKKFKIVLFYKIIKDKQYHTCSMAEDLLFNRPPTPKDLLVIHRLRRNNLLYYSTVMSFNLIREREHAKYQIILHGRLPYYT